MTLFSILFFGVVDYGITSSERVIPEPSFKLEDFGPKSMKIGIPSFLGR
jgi:hypothetical protein